jgi:hypothetical protein
LKGSGGGPTLQKRAWRTARAAELAELIERDEYWRGIAVMFDGVDLGRHTEDGTVDEASDDDREEKS